jgi:hypothetical protein
LFGAISNKVCRYKTLCFFKYRRLISRLQWMKPEENFIENAKCQVDSKLGDIQLIKVAKDDGMNKESVSE